MASTLAEIKDVIRAGKTERALADLRDYVAAARPAYVSEVTLLENRRAATERENRQGLLLGDPYEARRNALTRALLGLINQIETAADPDAGAAAGPPPVHDYHAYTVDRVEQNDAFYQVHRRRETTDKCDFYYLYGGDLHEHELFFRRLAYDIEGRLLDPANPDLPLACRVEQIVPTTIDFSTDAELYRQNMLRAFFAKTGLQPDAHAPLLTRDLTYLLAHAPRLQGLTAADFVTVYFKISDYEWDATLTPATLRWFIEHFCQPIPLPVAAPTFLFFFAVEYDEEDAAIKAEIKTAVDAAEFIVPLPELAKLQQRDIGRWLERYEMLFVPPQRPRTFLRATFAREADHYMADVHPILKKLIDEYNTRLIP